MTRAGEAAAQNGGRRAAVIVASTSAAAGEAEDRTGPAIRSWLEERGFVTGSPVIVPDGAAVGDALRQVLTAHPAVVITTGGTGISPDDATPEAVSPLLEVQLPGLVEELRRRGTPKVPTSLLTRGVAGFAANTFVMTLPGSPGGVRDGLAVLDPLLEHLLAQRAGGGADPHRAADRSRHP